MRSTFKVLFYLKKDKHKVQPVVPVMGTLDDMNNQNITLWLTNLDLRDFGPYCEHYTAYPLTKGNLTFRSQNVIRNRYLDGTNHLDMFEPKVDKKRRR